MADKTQYVKKRICLAVFSLIASFCGVFAQSDPGSLEFTENKGQWNAAVLYRAELPNTSFYLQKHGFSLLLQSPGDMAALREIMHGHSSSSGKEKQTEPAAGAKNPGNATLADTKPGPKFPSGGNQPPGGPASGISLLMHSHYYRVEFLNSSEEVEITGDKKVDTYNNYFIGNDSTKWKSHCRIFQAIVYKNIYPHIDLRYYTDRGQLKYDLVVHPGGDPRQIRIKYHGAEKLMVNKSTLTIQTSVGNVEESIPKCYQFTSTGTKDVECGYVAGPDTTIQFQVAGYSPSATLIIDPTLIFSTFTGSSSDNWGYTATYDESGNFYSGSITLFEENVSSGEGFPTTPGAYQRKYQGGDENDDGGYQYDITIMKFNPTGTARLYATYIGGKGNEQPHSLVADAAGNLVIAGRTSSANYPVLTSNGTIDKNHGGYDIVLTKLNATGTALIGSRMIGGSGYDGVNIAPKYFTGGNIRLGQNSLRLNYGDDGRSEVILDKQGNVYLASCTASTDFPTVGPFQNKSGGMQDGVFIKTNPDLSTILASSYIGGNSDDAAFALALNPTNNNIYIVGGTSSPNFPGAGNASVIGPSKKAGIDGFLSILSGDGHTLIRTSYFGTDGTEVLYGVQFDNFGYPYIMGTTTGIWPVINASFSQANGKQFISKLRPDLTGYVYSTVFGKGAQFPDISPTAFLVDRCENVYVAGWGGGIEVEANGAAVYENSKTTGLTTTANAIKKTTDGDDLYFFVLQKNAVSQLYGSFYGQTGGLGDHVDGGTSRFDKQGVIYEAICANCYGMGTFPTTPGVWSPKNGTGNAGCNLAAIKIAFNFSGVVAEPRSLINGRYDSTGCVPLDVLFRDTIHNAKQYIWTFGDGSADTLTTTPQVVHTYLNIGSYTVRLIAIDSTTCNISDTAFLRIQVRNDKANLDFDFTKLPPCQSLSYLFTNTSVAPPGKPFRAGTFTWDFGDGSTAPGNSPVNHSYASSGTYPVSLILVDTSYCNFPDTVVKTLRVSAVVKAQFDVTDGCAPFNAVFNNTSLAGASFRWDFGDNKPGSSDVNPVHVYTDTGTFTITLVAIDSNTCNIADSVTRTIRVNPKPEAAFINLPVPALYNTPTVFYNNSLHATRYVWLFGDGDSAVRASTDTVIHQYQQTLTYNACLVAVNEFGCSDTVCHPVENLVNPLLDVPNAFTPGRFGQNGIIMVRGFGIQALNWKIYNRWGQIVFETNNSAAGWDGTFRGTAQPMDVYTYTLDVTFFDGTRTRRTGDITLIR